MAHSLANCMRVAAILSMILAGTTAAADTIHVPQDHTTIQQAIDAAQSGDTIIVAPGTYHENLTIEFKSLTLQSQSDAVETIIAAADPQTVTVSVAFIDAPDLVTIDGFTITGGRGGVSFDFAEGTVMNCTVDENHGNPGIDFFWSFVTIDNCVITDNGGSETGGGGIRANLSSFDLHDTTIAHNRGGDGGGLRLIESVGDIDHCTFEANESELGAGILVGQADVSITNTTFVKNVSLDQGGALYIGSPFGATVHISGCTLRYNTSPLGGGLLIEPNPLLDVDISQTTFCGNSVDHIDGNWTDLGENSFTDTCHSDGDLNGDGVVNVADLLILLAAWGPCPRATECPADLNNDGVVDATDLLQLLAKWD